MKAVWAVRSMLVVGALTAMLLSGPPAGAVGDSGASSRVVGRGNIVTSILGWTGPVRSRPGATAPTCA